LLAAPDLFAVVLPVDSAQFRRVNAGAVAALLAAPDLFAVVLPVDSAQFRRVNAGAVAALLAAPDLFTVALPVDSAQLETNTAQQAALLQPCTLTLTRCPHPAEPLPDPRPLTPDL
ncbi:MAG: hypothetical protein M3Z04_07135, partial [Chloroflexota bacterium]|nr:hypothetical protein [Chloroflexota bacterium]